MDAELDPMMDKLSADFQGRREPDPDLAVFPDRSGKVRP
jgi:hypothetical protein